jgi:CubicO group peptidase (beta-lactamase class C family)
LVGLANLDWGIPITTSTVFDPLGMANTSIWDESAEILSERATGYSRLGDGWAIDYALGLTLDRYRGVRRVQHGGSWAGFRAMLARYPDQEFEADGLGITFVREGGRVTGLRVFAGRVTGIVFEKEASDPRQR